MTLIPFTPPPSPPARARLQLVPAPGVAPVPLPAGKAGTNAGQAFGVHAGARCPNPESDGSRGVYLLSAPPAAAGRRLTLIKPGTDPSALSVPRVPAVPPAPASPPAPPWSDREAGMATAEYAIATLAAVAFAGLLAVVLSSDEVRSMLVSLIRSALTLG